jgi:hypothetical protein
MDAKRCADIWKKVVEIYHENFQDGYEVTVERLVKKYGLKDVLLVFSTVAKIKEHDGRIYGRNREFMQATPYVPEAVEWTHPNPMMRAGIDEIHTSHINQMIGELRKRAEVSV